MWLQILNHIMTAMEVPHRIVTGAAFARGHRLSLHSDQSHLPGLRPDLLAVALHADVLRPSLRRRQSHTAGGAGQDRVPGTGAQLGAGGPLAQFQRGWDGRCSPGGLAHGAAASEQYSPAK